MFSTIRFMLFCIIFMLLSFIGKKIKVFNKKKGAFLAIVITTVIIITSVFLPFENTIASFSTPEAAFRYIHNKNIPVIQVVEGYETDLVIGKQQDSNIIQILPKTKDGWKISYGGNTKIVSQKNTNGIIIHIYQYKNTNEFYISVLNSKGGVSEIADSLDSQFVSIKSTNDSLKESFVKYYAYVPNFNSQYVITVNKNQITFNQSDDFANH